LIKKYFVALSVTFLFLTTKAQDYNFVFNYIKANADEQTVKRFKEIIEKKNAQHLVQKFKQNFISADSLVEVRDKTGDDFWDEFDENNILPKQHSYCKEYDRLNSEQKMLERRLNQASVITGLAKTNYSLCTKSDCSKEYNEYNKQNNNYNSIVNKYNYSIKKSTSAYEKCQSIIKEYNAKLATSNSLDEKQHNLYNKKIKTLEAKNKTILADIRRYIDNELFTHRSYYDNKQLKSTGNYYFRSGLRSGEWKLYYENGQLDQTGILENDKRQGEWNFYNKKGTLTLTKNFDTDNANGKVIAYYDNGKTKFTGKYSNNKKEGFWKSYHENGKVKSMGFYKNDKLSGTWKIYDENGSTVSTETY